MVLGISDKSCAPTFLPKAGKMLRAYPHVDRHTGRLQQIASIGMSELPAALPVFGRSLGVNNQRVGLGEL
jgi:hypothetical protein